MLHELSARWYILKYRPSLKRSFPGWIASDAFCNGCSSSHDDQLTTCRPLRIFVLYCGGNVAFRSNDLLLLFHSRWWVVVIFERFKQTRMMFNSLHLSSAEATFQLALQRLLLVVSLVLKSEELGSDSPTSLYVSTVSNGYFVVDAVLFFGCREYRLWISQM